MTAHQVDGTGFALARAVHAAGDTLWRNTMKNTRAVRHVVTPWALGLVASLCVVRLAVAADSPGTAEVLAKLHATSQKEIEMAKLAERHGKSKDVVAHAKELIKDHTAADKKIVALARNEKLQMPGTATLDKDVRAALEKSSNFDAHFVQAVLDDHKKIAHDLAIVRDNTYDEKLKALIIELLPMLKKHEAAAQKLVDRTKP
jgi:putative membrane protein